MSTPMYAVRLKSVQRYHYRGILYHRFSPTDRHGNGQRILLDHVVNRELRDHFIGSGYWVDVRPDAPEPIKPVAVAMPEPVAVDPEAEAAEASPSVEASNDMSTGSINGPRSYGQPGKGDTQTEV